MNAGEQPHERGTVIRRNYFHNIGESKAGVEGVYPDNFTIGLTIEENIFYKMGNSAIKNNGGAHILNRNNIFIDSKIPYDYADMFLGDEPDDQVREGDGPGRRYCRICGRLAKALRQRFGSPPVRQGGLLYQRLRLYAVRRYYLLGIAVNLI